MKALRAVLVMLALAAALAGPAARADDAGLSVKLEAGWDGAAVSGSWVPFQVTVTNGSASRDFQGQVVVQGEAPSARPSSYGASYQQAVSVAHATQKTVTIYGAYLDLGSGSGGYVATLVDETGRELARSPVAALTGQRLAVGLLSDFTAAAGQIKDVPLAGGRSGVVELTAKTLPASAAELSGLGAVVVDDFDSTTLSQAQGVALEQYVGLGGQLVLAAGVNWRRTLGQLPPALLPLAPAATGKAALEPLLDLLARHSDLVVTTVVGTLAPGARVVLADGSGNALLVELGYGAGRVVEMAFDPADEPLAGHPDETRAAWIAVLNRVGPPLSGVPRQSSAGVVLAPASSPGQLLLTQSGLEQALTALLNDSPVSSLPPLGILGGLLVLYVLLAGPVNYGVLRGLGRRELLWVTVPLTSLAFTAASYAAGIAVHGRSYYVNEIQVLRVSPSGAIEAAGYDAIFSPSRGSLTVQLGESTLASTDLASQVTRDSGTPDRVIRDSTSLLDIRNLPIWTPRDFKTEGAARSAIALEPHLRVEGGRVTGTLSNRGRSDLRRLELMTADGRLAVLAPLLRAGTTATISAPLKATPTQGTGPGVSCNESGCVELAPPPGSRDRESLVMVDAASSMISPSAQVQALTGIVDPVPGFRVNGSQPTRTVIAAFVLPVRLESVDALPAGWSAPRLVATNGLASDPVSVVDCELPPVPASVGLAISAGTAASIGFSAPPGRPAVVEIYDWTASAWRPADFSHAFQLSAGERVNGLVRLRVRGSLYLQGLQVTSR